MTERISDGRRTAAFRHSRAILLAACVTAMAAGGCHRAADTAQGVSVHQTIGPQPVQVGVSAMRIQLADSFSRPITHATIVVEGDMSHPGMAPVFEKAVETSPGSYIAHLNLNMNGDWVVLSHIVLADGRKLERQMDVRGVGSNR